MVLLCPRLHFYEINDQAWFPQYLREKVQSCLTLAWTFRTPILQKTSPAKLVAGTLYDVLSASVSEYTYIDFCSGAGGPTPFIEQDLNLRLSKQSTKPVSLPKGPTSHMQRAKADPVKFILTDIHPHIPDWTEASKKSDNLSFIAEPVDAANAPSDLIQNGDAKVFRLFNLAFHHFTDDLGQAILKNTVETADGFGIFELQERTLSSLLTIFAMGLLFFIITPIYFWRSPGHLFFTYVIPIIPFVLVFDGYISSLRTRTPAEIQALLDGCGASKDGWTVKSGSEQHTFPTGYMNWVIGIKS